MYLMKQCQVEAQKANMETMCRQETAGQLGSFIAFLQKHRARGPNLATRGGSGLGREGNQGFAKTLQSSHSLNPQRAGPTLSSRVTCAALSTARGEPVGEGGSEI